QAARPRF
nr:RecName: Full=Neuropeptide F; Short=NPF; AltName: Full=Hez-MP-I [Helicoverpa zea]